MYYVHFEKEVAVAKDIVWKYLTDLPHYPDYMAFVQSVHPPSEIKPGVSWYDSTTVLWFPMKITHHIEKMDGENIVFRLYGSGIVYEEEHMRVRSLGKNKTLVSIDVAFTLTGILHVLFGKLVQYRIYLMCKKSAEQMEAHYYSRL